MNVKGIDRVFIEKKDREDIYEKLLKNRGSPLYGKNNRVPYILALVVGFTKGERLKIVKKDGFILIENLQDEDLSLIKAIAVKEDGNLDVLLDREKVFRIADEYANCGIKLLNNSILGKEYGSYFKKLEAELIDKFNEVKGSLDEA